MSIDTVSLNIELNDLGLIGFCLQLVLWKRRCKLKHVSSGKLPLLFVTDVSFGLLLVRQW